MKRIKKLWSVILALILIGTGTMMMAQAQVQATIGYTFSGADALRAGYARGTVVLNAPDGDYLLYWADDAAALEGWYPIACVSVTGGEGRYLFGERVAIPAGATRLIAVAAGHSSTVADAAAAAVIPADKRFPAAPGERQYRCEVLSDIHIDCQDGGANVYYTDASANFLRALNIAQERGADFVITAGDQITNASGAALEWMEYQRVLASSDYDGPVYEAIGNHEMRYSQYSDCEAFCGVEAFMAATGLDGTAAAIQARKPYFSVTEPVSGDRFIFMALEGGYSPNENDEFSDAQIAWLEEQLSLPVPEGSRVFVIQHALILGYGAGDDRDDPAYDGAMSTAAAYPNNLRFQQLMEQYRDVVWLSGHSHVDLRDNVNFSDEDGTSCLMFHVPSVAATTRLAYDEEGKRTLDRTFTEDGSQGYFLDAYSGAALLCGVNFVDNLYYPAYTYIIGDTPEGSAPTEGATAAPPTAAPSTAPSGTPADTPSPGTEPTSVTPSQAPTAAPGPAPSELPSGLPAEDPTQVPGILGDADGDGELSVLDATAIQRHLAGLEQLAGARIDACLLDGSTELNIIDATLIQRRLAGIISRFPVEEGLAPTAGADLSATVKDELDVYQAYASYPEYAALKRASRAADTDAMQSALSAFRALRGRVKLTTVYYTDAKGKGHPYAYAWNSASGRYIEPWPGQKTTYVRKNSLDQQIYAVTVDAARYDRIVFSAGESKTADICLTGQSGRIYYPISDDSPYAVSFSIYEKMWRTDSGEYAEIYFTDTEGWGTPYVYYWTPTGNNSWPGTKMTFVRQSSTGKKIYSATVPADAGVVFSNGDKLQTADVPAVADGFGYYPYGKDDAGKWTVVEYLYSE